MNTRLSTVALAVAITFTLSASVAHADDAAAAAPDAPRHVIEQNHAQFETLIKEEKDEAKMREKIREAMDGFVDYEIFSKLAAKKFWDEMKPAQQKEYVGLFTRLIQRTYLKRFKANKPFKVELMGDTEYNTKKTKAVVRSVIESGKIAADVEYKLYSPKKKEGWWVYDVKIDDVSVMRNYRTSFNKTWKKGGYDLLISKMKKKLEKVEKTGDDDDDDIGDLE